MELSEAADKRIAAAIVQAFRDDGLIIVTVAPTASMIKAAKQAAPDLTDDQIESIYFLMTNAWLTRAKGSDSSDQFQPPI